MVYKTCPGPWRRLPNCPSLSSIPLNLHGLREPGRTTVHGAVGGDTYSYLTITTTLDDCCYCSVAQSCPTHNFTDCSTTLTLSFLWVYWNLVPIESVGFQRLYSISRPLSLPLPSGIGASFNELPSHQGGQNIGASASIGALSWAFQGWFLRADWLTCNQGLSYPPPQPESNSLSYQISWSNRHIQHHQNLYFHLDRFSLIISTFCFLIFSLGLGRTFFKWASFHFMGSSDFWMIRLF